ncbi:MAG TPA: FtsX-like permease family protein, partial [Rhizomicrobium sp.]|nr:FtsX-like permease family protein [Rhizomicrobium sp.]
IYLAFGAVLMVLLIACANVANLVMAKGATRGKEMALRASLGASRGRLIAQLLTESLVLCLLGGAAGVAMAYLLLRAAAPLVAGSLPFTADLSLDPRVFGFAAVIVMAVLILTGLLPSLQTSFCELAGALNQGARGSSGSSAAVRRIIVIAEVAASVVLICGAALLFRSLEKLQQVDAGVRIDHVITMSMDLPSTGYPTPASAARFYDAAVQQLRQTPEVEQASLSQGLPLGGVQWGEYLSVPGVPEPLLVRVKLVDPHYFGVFEIPVLSGRGIEDRDRAGAAPVVVINQKVAGQLQQTFGIASPVGRTVAIDVTGYGPVPESLVKFQIVGVIRNERTAGLNAPPELVVYVPLAQFPRQDISLAVRTRSDPAAAMSGIREAMRQVDAHLPLGDVRTMEQVKEESTLWVKQPTWVVGAFAGVAALMAALGFYGVLAHAVTQQRREIGIRMALGARPGDVVSRTLGSALGLLLVGLALGLAGAFALTRALKSLLFQVSALDPAALAVGCALMALVGMLAALIPASRAATVDPMTVLRDEG